MQSDYVAFEGGIIAATKARSWTYRHDQPERIIARTWYHRNQHPSFQAKRRCGPKNETHWVFITRHDRFITLKSILTQSILRYIDHIGLLTFNHAIGYFNHSSGFFFYPIYFWDWRFAPRYPVIIVARLQFFSGHNRFTSDFSAD